MKRCPSCEASYPSRFSMCPQDGSKLVESGGWSEGSVIRGKYRILGKVGQGGMGAVYKATHVTFEELRAVKVMNPELLGDALFVKRFKQEAVIARKLDHPNAVRVDDIDESEDGLPFMVMEYIEGQSLKGLIEQHGPLPPARVCSIVRQVASALNAAHRLGMVHRDIKPANIVLIQTPEGEQAKVLDFGIAKIKESRAGDSGMTLTGTGMVMGTPQYMSPEQALGKRGDQIDGRSDLYSLGVVMYQMLTGTLPFKTDTTMQLLLAHINTPPRPLLEARPDLNISPALARVVMTCLEKDPNLRPPTGEALIQGLAAAGSGTREGAPLDVESSGMATMIATPAALAETYAAPKAPTLAQASAASSATATATPPALEAPSIAVAPPAAHRSRWVMGLIATLIVIALGGGAVWGGFHFGYFKSLSPEARTQAGPLANTAPNVNQPAAVQPPATLSSTTAGPGALAESTQPTQPGASSAPPPAELKPDEVKTSALKSLATKGVGRTVKTNPAQPVHETATPQQGASGRLGERQEVASAGPAPAAYNPSLATVVLATAPGAEIYIDGKKAGTASSTGQLTVQNLAAGVHSLRATLPGFNDIDSNFNLPPGGTGFLNAKWGATQATLAPSVARQPQSGSPATSNAQPGAAVAASFPVEYLHRLGSSKGLLAIEGRTVRYQPSNGKDAFTAPLTGIRWGSNGGAEFYVRLADGKTVKFRSSSSTAILSALHRAATAP
ncbi:MAG: protein kinase domain-containing protein [Terriglobia bacterium]